MLKPSHERFSFGVLRMSGHFILPIQALWRLCFLKKNDANLLLLVRSNFWKEYYNMVKLFATATDTIKIF